MVYLTYAFRSLSFCRLSASHFLPVGPPLTLFVNDRFEENLPRFDY
jgi:hypothetical protein